MGAWAEDAFGNDSGCDWAGEFAESPGIGKVEQAIDAVIAGDDYLDSYEAEQCLVACEVIARLKGQWGDRSAYSEAVDKWVESSKEIPSEELVSKAKAAIARILSKDSELYELWNEDEINEDWLREMNDLLKRVSA